jgi:N-methylhydantoinase A
MNYKIGVDVGGTFTDVFLLNETTGQLAVHKVSSTPEDPSKAIIHGVSEILQIHQIPPDQVTYLAHGTTVATNAIIEQKEERLDFLRHGVFRIFWRSGDRRGQNYTISSSIIPVRLFQGTSVWRSRSGCFIPGRYPFP